MPVKTAQSLTEEFVRAASPGFDFYWLASAGHISAAVIARYDSALLDLKRKNQRINWDDVTDIGQAQLERPP